MLIWLKIEEIIKVIQKRKNININMSKLILIFFFIKQIDPKIIISTRLRLINRFPATKDKGKKTNNQFMIKDNCAKFILRSIHNT